MSNEAAPPSVSAAPMKFLLDVNALLAGVWGHHSRHTEAFAWLKGKSIVLCPLAELGFLRISSNKRAINVEMDKAREALEKFCAERSAKRILTTFPRWIPSRRRPSRSPTSISPIWQPSTG